MLLSYADGGEMLNAGVPPKCHMWQHSIPKSDLSGLGLHYGITVFTEGSSKNIRITHKTITTVVDVASGELK